MVIFHKSKASGPNRVVHLIYHYFIHVICKQKNILGNVSIFSPLLPSTVPKLLNKSSHIFDLVSYLKPTMGKTSILLL